MQRIMLALVGVSGLIAGCVCAVGAGEVDGRRSPIPVSRETTYVAGPIDERGYVDYAAALDERLGRGVVPQENFVAALWQIVGPTYQGKKVPAAYFAALGIAPPEAGGRYYVSYETFAKQFDDHVLSGYDFSNLVERAGERPWTSDEFPRVALWLGLNDGAANRIVEATRRPHFFRPQRVRADGEADRLLWFYNCPEKETSLEWARLLVARAMLRIGERKFEAAWTDLLACHRLGAVVSRGPFLFEFGWGCAIARWAAAADEAFVGQAAWSREKLESCLNDLEAIRPFPSPADSFEFGERLVVLETMQVMSRPDDPRFQSIRRFYLSEPTTEGIEHLANLDVTPAMREANRWCDRVAESFRIRGRIARIVALFRLGTDLDSYEEELEKRGTTSNRDLVVQPGKTDADIIAKFVLHETISPAWWVREVDESRLYAEQMLDMSKLAFALAAHRAEHRGYPDKLNELIPRYLATIPKDRFSSRSLTYRRTDDGYVLLSLGKDEVDQENELDEYGKPADDNYGYDDIRIQTPYRAPTARRSARSASSTDR